MSGHLHLMTVKNTIQTKMISDNVALLASPTWTRAYDSAACWDGERRREVVYTERQNAHLHRWPQSAQQSGERHRQGHVMTKLNRKDRTWNKMLTHRNTPGHIKLIKSPEKLQSYVFFNHYHWIKNERIWWYWHSYGCIYLMKMLYHYRSRTHIHTRTHL